MKEYVLKVSPWGEEKTAFREIHITETKSMDQLCNCILKAFDFIPEHLYEFSLSNQMYDPSNIPCEQDYPGQRTTRSRLSVLKLCKGQCFSLHYDFGDDWMFKIVVKDILTVEKNSKPFVSAGKGEVIQYAQPEDWEDEEYAEDEDPEDEVWEDEEEPEPEVKVLQHQQAELAMKSVVTMLKKLAKQQQDIEDAEKAKAPKAKKPKKKAGKQKQKPEGDPLDQLELW